MFHISVLLPRLLPKKSTYLCIKYLKNKERLLSLKVLSCLTNGISKDGNAFKLFNCYLIKENKVLIIFCY